MKKIAVLLVILSIVFINTEISHSSHYWVKTYGGSGSEQAQAIKQTTDGGYIVTGPTNSFGAGVSDLWVMKLNEDGGIIWQKTYGGILYEATFGGSSIVEMTDGTFIILGWTDSYGAGQKDALILKLDENGEILWQKAYGTSSIDYIASIQKTIDAGFIVAGSPDADYTIWVTKFDGNGNIMWQKNYRVDNANYIFNGARDIRQTPDGGYIVVGYVGSEWPGGEDIFVLKLDSNGTLTWQKTYGGSGGDFVRCMEETSDGGFILGGMTYSFGVDFIHPWLLKLDINGDVLFQRIYKRSTDGNDSISSIQQTSDGGYIVGADTNTHEATWIFKLDSNADVVWQNIYDINEEWETTNFIQQTMDNGYIIGGLVLQPSSEIGDAWVSKLDEDGVIPDCNIMAPGDLIEIIDTSITGQDISFIIQPSSGTVTDTAITPQDSFTVISDICCYDDTSDFDQDGVGDACDTCPLHPNSPLLGICFQGMWGNTCLSDEECSTGTLGRCSIDQTDNIHCDCKSNFDCDYDVDGSDAAKFKADFGRSQFDTPCTNEESCDGDFECDGDVDGTDAADFKKYFGVTPFSGYCLACVDGVYQYDCSY